MGHMTLRNSVKAFGTLFWLAVTLGGVALGVYAISSFTIGGVVVGIMMVAVCGLGLLIFVTDVMGSIEGGMAKRYWKS